MIAQMLGGTVEGNSEASVKTVARIEEGETGALSFLANPKYEEFIYTTGSSVVLVSNDFQPKQEISATLIRVTDPYSAFAALLEEYGKMMAAALPTGISDQAVLDPSANVAEGVTIHATAYIGPGARVGKGSVIHPGAKVLHGCILGENCTLHAGVTIGSDGFGFAPQNAQNYKKIPQIGNVILEDNVEIGANTTIDRATVGSTIIRKGVKLDNLIQVAHNVEIGENTVIAAQTGIAGSTSIGSNCMIGGQVGIIGHLKIGNGVMIAAQSGVGSDLPDGSIVQGSPAFDVKQYRRSYVAFRGLSDLTREVNRLSKELESLRSKDHD